MDNIEKMRQEAIDVEAREVTEEEIQKAKEEGRIEGGEPNWMSFIVGTRGDSIYECKTNIEETLLTDYIEALAGIDINVVVEILKSGGIEAVENFYKMREILVINSVRLMEGSIEQIGISPEQYAELRDFFGVDRILELLEQRKQEISEEMMNAEAPENNEMI